MLKIILSYTYFLSFSSLCIASQINPVTPLHVGSTVPDVAFENVLNFPGANFKLSTFRKKAILIEFWGSNCAACIQKFPMLDSVQKKYSADFSVLLVSSSKADTKEKVGMILDRLSRSKASKIGLPFILDDKKLNELFPHDAVPYYIWLDSNFKVVALTNTNEVSPARLESFIKGENLNFLENEQFKYDQHLPLFASNNGGTGKSIIARTTLSGYIPGLHSATFIDKNDPPNTRLANAQKVTKVVLTNQTILEFIKRAYTYFSFPERIDWPDTVFQTLNNKGRSGEWMITNSYTYELIIPPASYATAMSQMQEDIRKYFGYSAVREKTLSDCYTLNVDTTLMRTNVTKGGKRLNLLDDSLVRAFKNCTIFEMCTSLENLLKLPVIDESHYSGRVSIDLENADLKNFTSLKDALRNKGINIEKGQRFIDKLCIIETGKSSK